VIDLEHDQADDGEEQLRLAHAASLADQRQSRKFEREAAIPWATATRSLVRLRQIQYQ
jgi:hypothetical protein